VLTWHIRRNDSSKLCHFLKKRVGRVELDLIYSVGFKWGRNFIQKWTSVWSIDHFFVMTFLNVMTFSLKLVLPFNFNSSNLTNNTVNSYVIFLSFLKLYSRINPSVWNQLGWISVFKFKMIVQKILDRTFWSSLHVKFNFRWLKWTFVPLNFLF